MIIAHKKMTANNGNAHDKIDPSILSHEQLFQMVINLRRRLGGRRLGEQRAKADREIELVAIYRDTAKREREVVTQVNHQLLTQINIFVLGLWREYVVKVD